jgi:formamidopyrimidine-DNA glycosylase
LNYLNATESATVSNGPRCQHLNGWYITASFWVFKKRLFVCSDCGSAIEEKKPAEKGKP